MSNSEFFYEGSPVIMLAPGNQAAAGTVTSEVIDLANIEGTVPRKVSIVAATGTGSIGVLKLSMLKSRDNITFLPMDDSELIPYLDPTPSDIVSNMQVEGSEQVLHIGIGRKGFAKCRFIKAVATISDGTGSEGGVNMNLVIMAIITKRNVGAVAPVDNQLNNPY